MSRVKIGGSTNRQKGFRTPTPSESQCDYFEERFIGWGKMNERKAICEHPSPHQMASCDYLHVTQDGTPLCLRYWYGPAYEEQKIDPPSKELKEVPYIKNSMVKDPDTGKLIPSHPEFFSKQYEDTHEKKFGIVDRRLGWHDNI